ncbi:hypothetical protein TWF481_002134 [Arthrobotrys musiformis]|uniref:Uncharacterized protein n=1 Tax=Arthrobotrys musiformis TaxID=47236 RepID=A0AAV9VSB6_9PEZI
MSDQPSWTDSHVRPLLRSVSVRELCAGPAIVEILGIWNTYPLRSDIMAIEIEHDEIPNKNLLALLMSLSIKGRRALQQAHIYVESALHILAKAPVTMDSFYQLLEGQGSNPTHKDVLSRFIGFLRGLYLGGVQGKGLESMLKALKAWGHDVEVGIEAAGRAFAAYSRPRKTTSESGEVDATSNIVNKRAQNTIKTIIQELISLQSNICIMEGFFNKLDSPMEIVAKYDMAIKYRIEEPESGNMNWSQSADGVLESLHASWVSASTNLTKYNAIWYRYIEPGIEKVDELVDSGTGGLSLEEQIEMGRREMKKYFSEARAGIAKDQENSTKEKAEIVDKLTKQWPQPKLGEQLGTRAVSGLRDQEQPSLSPKRTMSKKAPTRLTEPRNPRLSPGAETRAPYPTPTKIETSHGECDVGHYYPPSPPVECQMPPIPHGDYRYYSGYR